MKHVAVIIFGQPRFFNITWPLIKQEFLFEDVQVDYYIHFWDQVGYTPKSNEVNTLDIYNDIDNILNKEFNSHNIQIDNYTELDELCLTLKSFYNDITSDYDVTSERNVEDGNGKICVVEDNLEDLRYRFGQHLSIKKAYDEILKHEKFQTDERRRAGLDKFEYDLIIKTRSDVIFRHPGCYKYNHEYTKIKKDYYFSAPSSHDSIDNGYIKCNALRLMDFEDMVFSSGEKIETIINAFHKNKFQELESIKGEQVITNPSPDRWVDYVEKYFIRLAFNDWTLIASRKAADIYFGKYFENFNFTVAKDLQQNTLSQRKRCILSSEHCIQGQFLLNYNILASLPLGDIRRDVRLLNQHEIKEGVSPKGKLLCTDGVMTTEYLEDALIRGWCIDKRVRQIKSMEMTSKYAYS